MDTVQILEKINRVPWFHAYEVVPGVTTPGRCRVDARSALDRYRLPDSLTGMRVLDIGAWDGPYSFELERRGAQVTALDIQDPDCTGFNTAKEIRRSNVRYVRSSVYDAAAAVDGTFDLILFLGVYYHLKQPVLAFEQIHRLLADDGIVIVEGECLRNWAPTPAEAARAANPVSWATRRILHGNGNGAGVLGPLRTLAARGVRRLLRPRPSRLARTMAKSPVPITLFYAGQYKQDATNWFVPNFACIREWLSEAGLELECWDFEDKVVPTQRFWGIARKSPDRRIPIEHGVVGHDVSGHA